MCGLSGFWRFMADVPEQTLREQARRMADTLTHRGPDDRDTWVDQGAGIAFGFRRLAILDLSPAARQPMASGDGRWVIIYNGEIYNYRELRTELQQLGTHFRSTSDTEVILEGCSAWDVAAIPRLWGMFAMALWDKQEQRLILARDRLGKKPLYYTHMNGSFLFGSELKSLRAHPSFRVEIDSAALLLYARYGYIPAPYSIYRGVRKLPPGYFAVVTKGMVPSLQCYWSARQVIADGLDNRLTISDGEAIEKLDSLLRDTVARRMIADVPLGALLSGGVDSSAVVALMQAQSTRPIKTFTIGFQNADYNEAQFAKRVASHLATDHTELYVSAEETQAVIPRLPEMYDEPFADSSQIPTFLICKLARQSVTVSLSGDGGDELFGGYQRYEQAERASAQLSLMPMSIRRLLAGLLSRICLYLPDTRLSHLFPWLLVRNESELYQRFVSLWREPENLVIRGDEPVVMWISSALPAILPDFTERMMYFDLVTYLPDDILVKLDRASMSVALEGRCPLLDHRLVEWIWRLPFRLKRRDSERKWLLRQVLYRYVPSELIERPKMGFGIPIGDWLRGPLRDWAESLLEESRLRQEGLLDAKTVQHSWTAHLSGKRDEQHRLWVVLMLQAWHRHWLKAY
jgi:asparagine synthase (glutamine-hydrolysing)